MEQNLSLYHIFYTVANTGNISKAAAQLYISQPAISKSIGRLEQSLNTELFIRNSRGVQLTEEGQTLYQYVESAFSSIQAGEEKLSQIKELGMGHIRIGVSTTLCRYTLIPYLKDFIKAHPHIQITIQCQSSNRTLKLLEDQSIDLGLIGRPKSLPQFQFHPVNEIEDIFVATPAYLDNLKLRTDDDGASLLSKAELMLLDKENLTRQYMDRYLTLNRISTDNVLEVSTMDLLIEFAKIGLGVACVIKQFVQEELTRGELVEIPLEVPSNKREIGFACTGYQSSSHAVQEFLTYCVGK